MKSAAEKITDPDARGVAEKAYGTLQKVADDGNAAENKIREARDIFKTSLGCKASGEGSTPAACTPLDLRLR